MTKEIATELFNAQSEADVGRILDTVPEADWEPIGHENNYGTIENQAAKPMAAFAEIVTNSTDAIVLKNYWDRFGKEYDPETGVTTYAAAEEAFDLESESVEIVADGAEGNDPNLSVLDTGHGQSPDDFKETFVGLYQPGKYKSEWPFLQGQYGMGSKGVLPFCGDRRHQLIISASVDDPKRWGWTITRVSETDKNWQEASSRDYQYLTIGGDIPTFGGKFQNREHGTIVKLFEYGLVQTSHITSAFRHTFDRVIWSSPVPVEIRDDREYLSSAINTVTTHGGRRSIESIPEVVQNRWTVHWDFGRWLGERPIEFVLFKDDDTLDGEGLSKRKKDRFVGGDKHAYQAIFFIVNGQTHAGLGETFIKNRCNKYHSAKDTLIFVDFSDISGAPLADLFKPSRDRLTGKPVADELMGGLEKAIKEDEVLDNEEERRKRKVVKREVEKSKSDILQSVLDSQPGLEAMLSAGKTPHIGGVEQPAETYEAPDFPTRFEIITGGGRPPQTWDDSKGVYTRRMPVNRESNIRFWLNAPNDYFTREEVPGTFEITPSEVVKSWSLTDGILHVGIEPLDGVEDGDSLPVTTTVTRPGREALAQRFRVEYMGAEEPEPPGEEHGEREPAESRYDLPPRHLITEDGWGELGWDETDVVDIVGNDPEDMELYINVDSGAIRQFRAVHNLTKTGKEVVEETWEYGVAFYSLGQFMTFKNDYNGEAPDLVSTAMKGTAWAMLPQHLRGRLEELTV